MSMEPSEVEPELLRTLAVQFPNIDWAMAEIARLSAVLTLPKGTIHVISDIQGAGRRLLQRALIFDATSGLLAGQ